MFNKPIESAKGDIDAFEKAERELMETEENLASAEEVSSTFLKLTRTHIRVFSMPCNSCCSLSVNLTIQCYLRRKLIMKV